MASVAPLERLRTRARSAFGTGPGPIIGAATPLGNAVLVVAVVALSVLVARYGAMSGNLLPVVAGIAGIVGLAMAAIAGRARPILFGGIVALTLLIPDVLTNGGLGSAVIALVAVLAGLALLDAPRVIQRVTPLDAAAVLIFIAGGVLPALVSGTPNTIAGNGALILGTYAVARIGAPSWDRVVMLLLAVATIHAVVSILWAIPATSALVPFVPIQDGEPNPSSRATALFNNPNTYGVVVAMIVALALWHGVGRRGAVAVLLCFIGLLLSGSREALVGLLAAVAVIAARTPGRAMGPAAALSAIVALFLAFVPGAQERFNPSGFSEDSSLLERFELWEEAAAAFARSPILGYGHTSGLRAVDQAYLNWLVDGGIIGASIWLVAIGLILAVFPARPVVVLMLVVGLLGNPFAGPALGTLLILLAASHRAQPDPLARSGAAAAGPKVESAGVVDVVERGRESIRH